METTEFTAEDWAKHEKFVQAFRAAKQRKREEEVRRRREEIDALFDD